MSSPSLISRLRRRSTGSWIPELDGLRFIAIVSVVLFHLNGQVEHDYLLTVQSRYSTLAGWPLLFLLSNSLMELWLPFLALLLYVAAFRGVVMFAILRNAWIAVIGGMCYTIYLWHAVVLTVVQRVIDKWLHTMPADFALGFLLLAVLKAIVIAIVCLPLFLFIERPCMDPKWPQKLLDRVRFRNASPEPQPIPAATEESSINQ